MVTAILCSSLQVCVFAYACVRVRVCVCERQKKKQRYCVWGLLFSLSLCVFFSPTHIHTHLLSLSLSVFLSPEILCVGIVVWILLAGVVCVCKCEEVCLWVHV